MSGPSCSCGKYTWDKDRWDGFYAGIKRSTYEIHSSDHCKEVKFSKWRWRMFRWAERFGHWLAGRNPEGVAAYHIYEEFRDRVLKKKKQETRADIRSDILKNWKD